MGGQKSRKITEEIGNFLIQYLKDHPMSTLLNMKSYLTNRHQKDVSLSTISNFLRDKNVTMKLVRDVISSRNSETTKQKRFDYASKILEGSVDLQKCIFIDETGFNHGIRQTNGSSSKGSRCFKICPTSQGQNISLCMAISIN